MYPSSAFSKNKKEVNNSWHKNNEFLIDLDIDFSKVVRDINTKFSPVVNLNRYPLCTKFEGIWCLGFGFPAKNV